MREFEFYRCEITDPDVEYIQAYYGLERGAFPTEQLLTQSPQQMKRVYFITKSMSRYLLADSDQHQLKIISVGCSAFMRNHGKNSQNVECIFRVCQDGIHFLLPWLKNRIVYTECLDTFKRFIIYRYHDKNVDIKDKQLAETVGNMSSGCFIVIFKTGDAAGNVEPLTMHNFGSDKISTMITKENLFSLQMRYLDSSEQLLYGQQIINGQQPDGKQISS